MMILIIFALALLAVFMIIEIIAYKVRENSFKIEDDKVKEVLRRKSNFTLPEIKIQSPLSGIPRNILQTYSHIDNVPSYVFENLRDKNEGWKYYFFNDKECEEFISKNYGDKVLKKYLSVQSKPHRADIFRLCWLYLNGGVYVDIDTHILISLDELVKLNENKFSIPITHDRLSRKRLLNCIIITEKGNKLIRDCLENILKVEADEVRQTKYYYLYLLCMQHTLGDEFKYQMTEVNKRASKSYLLSKENWVIKLGSKEIARSKYKEYSHGSGFL